MGKYKRTPISSLALLERSTIPEPTSGCWLWTGPIGRHGYGKTKRSGKTIFSHRLAWMVHRGPIPLGIFVLHRCDVPSRVNPNHLFLGTARDNTLDMLAKGRNHRRGPTLSCFRGHPWTQESSYSWIRESGRADLAGIAFVLTHRHQRNVGSRRKLALGPTTHVA